MRIVGCTHSHTYRPELYISLRAFSAQAVKEAPMKKGALYLGIAQIAIAPPPFTQTGTLGHFISGPI